VVDVDVVDVDVLEDVELVDEDVEVDPAHGDAFEEVTKVGEKPGSARQAVTSVATQRYTCTRAQLYCKPDWLT
jgi:hypothetical protein